MASIRRLSGVTILTIAALFVLAAPGASQRQRTAPSMEAAQGWSGTAGVGVEVRDRDGHPVQGAEVRLAYAGSDGSEGPPPVETDVSGRAAVRGLAEGEWVLTVRHPDTMAYVATLQVRKGKRPRELAASQVKVGDSLRPLRLKYFEESGPAERPMAAAPPPPVERPAPKPAPAREPTAPTPEEASAEPMAAAPPAAEPAAAESPVPEAKPTPAPKPEPGPGPETEPEPRPERGPAPEQPSAEVAPAVEETPSPEPMTAPVPAAEEMAQPAPESEPEREPAPPAASEPAQEAATAAPAPRRSTLRSFEAGTCPECRPGEWSVTAEGSAAPGSGACPDDLQDRVDRAAALLGSSRALGPWTGPIEIAGGASSVLGSEAYGRFTAAMRDILADDATCRALAVMLPAGATFVGLEMAVADEGSWRQCLPGKECVAGSGWIGDPWVVRTPAGPLVAGAYGNGGTVPRRVRLTVYFKAPAGWAPR